ncbi:hypothetical protein, partial [uncultured Cohaesibacter sp.]|uniref:hypothetical protein n=1 Tax=uncultured Cohaesibacter sp. TaxID=1002546 RepID=UPI0029C78A64
TGKNYINPILIGAALIASLWATILLIKQRRLEIRIKQRELDEWEGRSLEHPKFRIVFVAVA